jgi:hypothetical protein
MSTVCSPSLHNRFFFADLRPEPAIISTVDSSCACAGILTCHQQQALIAWVMIFVTFIICDLIDISIDALLA